MVCVCACLIHQRAFEALSNSTHLYGRRLVLEWADSESDTLDELRRKTAQHFVDGWSLLVFFCVMSFLVSVFLLITCTLYSVL